MYAIIKLVVASWVFGGFAAPQRGADDELVPVPIVENAVALTPKTVTLAFVGTHVGPQPDPNARHCQFGQFSGVIHVDADAKSISKVEMQIDINSIATPNQGLTGHLLTADFFNAENFPKATFKSTEIKAGDHPGAITIVGELEMLGTKAVVEVPATYDISDEGLTLHGKTTIQRSKHGMNKMLERVNDDVVIEIHVGRPTPEVQPAPGRGRRRG